MRFFVSSVFVLFFLIGEDLTYAGKCGAVNLLDLARNSDGFTGFMEKVDKDPIAQKEKKSDPAQFQKDLILAISHEFSEKYNGGITTSENSTQLRPLKEWLVAELPNQKVIDEPFARLFQNLWRFRFNRNGILEINAELISVKAAERMVDTREDAPPSLRVHFNSLKELNPGVAQEFAKWQVDTLGFWNVSNIDTNTAKAIKGANIKELNFQKLQKVHANAVKQLSQFKGTTLDLGTEADSFTMTNTALEAILLDSMNKPDEAIKCLERLVRKHPDFALGEQKLKELKGKSA